MTQNTPNPYEQYSYDHYDQAPRARGTRRQSSFEGGLNFAPIIEKVRSPLVATAALLAVGAVFAGVIIASYPDSQDEKENVPVVQAAMGPFKETPSEPGGMQVPNRDSTVFSALEQGSLKERPPVENLLAQEQPVDKLEAFSEDVENIIKDEEAAKAQQAAEAKAASAAEPAAGGSSQQNANPDPAAVETSTDETAPTPSEDELAESSKSPVEVKTIIQEQEKVTPQELIAEARPENLHAPASAPETIEFVRSVLDKKDTEKVLNAPADGQPAAQVAQAQSKNIAAAMNEVRPASGTPASAEVTPGSYYIQLGSVKSRDGAASEWGKLQKAFPSSLTGLDYRVQEANLGDRGTFFRIQAGPVSKDSATSLCDAIKAEKPGACLVVQ